MFKIRPFVETDEEYARIIEINNALWPERQRSAENYRYDDENRNPALFFRRLVIELDDPSLPAEENRRIIGEMHCGQEEYQGDPGRYDVGFQVDPLFGHLEYGEDGIGPAAVAAWLTVLHQHDPNPRCFVTHWREDKPERIAFLQGQGFVQTMRYQESALDVTTFDPSPFLPIVQQVESMGIEILALPALQARFEDWMERIYEMDMEILPDEPSTVEFAPEPIEEYAKMFNYPAFLADGWFVAVDGDTCVGSSSIWNNKADPRQLYTNFTGVRRSHRRKGVAMALKLAVIAYVQRRGATHLITDNEENNPMYQINVKLGFKPRPGWLEFQKKL